MKHLKNVSEEDQDEYIRQDEQEESTQGNESTVSSDHDLQFIGICTSEFDELRKVTVKLSKTLGPQKGKLPQSLVESR